MGMRVGPKNGCSAWGKEQKRASTAGTGCVESVTIFDCCMKIKEENRRCELGVTLS